MKRNKKGFTLVELVIVIAVIAILAAVLLPTFAGIINRARANAALQRATSIRDEFFGEHCESYSQLHTTGITTKIYINENNELYVFELDEAGNLSPAASAAKVATNVADALATTTSDYTQVYNKAAVKVTGDIEHVAGNFIMGGLTKVAAAGHLDIGIAID